jgi:predicted TIM-barrel fold metal-dependent hydrolase
MVRGDDAVSTARHGDETFTVEQALAGMDAVGVELAVLHPPDWDPASTGYATDAIAAHPTRFGRYATFDLTAPDGPDQLKRLHATPEVLGLRFLCLAPEQHDWPHQRHHGLDVRPRRTRRHARRRRRTLPDADRREGAGPAPGAAARDRPLRHGRRPTGA